MLYEIAKQLGLKNDHKVLDVGCGKGNHSCELALRFGCSVIGLDPVASSLEQGRATATEAGVADRVIFRKGKITEIPFEDEAFHFIWCRDMLVHVDDLGGGIRECARVLKSDGAMIVFTTFATELMEPKERGAVCRPLEIVSENLSPGWVEQTFRAAGFQVSSSEVIGGELIEYYEEQRGQYSKELMRLARMVRAKDKFIAELGPERYEIALALYRWGIYLLLGKLSSAIYVLLYNASSLAGPATP